MEKTISLWQRFMVRYAEKKRKKNLKQLEIDSAQRLQIMEFDGKTYISYSGVPIVCTEYLNSDTVGVIKASRESWIDFKYKELYSK